jgi:hypothetical protein
MPAAKSTSWKLTTPDEILRQAEEHAQRLAQAARATYLCDQEKIATLLRKRVAYLGNPARKIVWCASIEDFLQKISQESSRSLLHDERQLTQYEHALNHEIYSQLQTICKNHWPNRKFSDFLATLRERVQRSFGSLPQKSKDLDKKLKEHLFTLYVREGKKFGPIQRLDAFSGKIFDFLWCCLYDCPFECLPDKTKMKNYFAYTGQMREAGLWIYIPSKTAEYLIPVPSRFFVGSAQGQRENAPRIEWRTEENARDIPSEQISQVHHDTDRILKKLEVFLGKLEGLMLHQEVAQETKKIIEKISHVLLRLRKGYPSSGLTYEVRRIADSWLIELIISYANLSQTNRETKRQTLLESLTLLDTQIDAILAELELRRVSDFDVMTTFLRTTFGANSLEV